MTRNPHGGEPFADADATIAAALGDVSIPALLCSLVHMTGDVSWIRGAIRPRLGATMDFQIGIPVDEQEEIRRRAVPAIAAYRDNGCLPHDLPEEVLREAMSFLGGRPVEGRMAGEKSVAARKSWSTLLTSLPLTSDSV